jgi:type I restriction enzyme S subunit
VSRPFPTVPLADVASLIQYGFTASASLEPVGPKFLRITDIAPSRINWSSVPFCEITAKDHAKYRVEPGDIVIARTGATVGYAKQLRDPPDAVFASYLIRVRVSDACDARYIGCVVESAEYKRFIASNAGGAAQPNANAKVLTSYPVPLPPLAVQRKIAALLTSYEDLIENNSRRVEILDRMARSIYREWFVEFRYPGHEDGTLADSEVGPAPSGWERQPLGSAVELAYGKALKAGDRNGGPVAVYGSGGVVGWHDASLDAGPGIVVGRKGNVGSVYWCDGPFFPIDTTYFVRTKLSLPYVYFALQDMEFIDSHAAVPGLSRGQAYGLPLLVPPTAVVARFDEAMTPLFRLRRVLLDATDRLRATRDLLLPRLISGEVDVSSLDLDLDGLVA